MRLENKDLNGLIFRIDLFWCTPSPIPTSTISGNIDIAGLDFYYSRVSAGLWKPSWNQYFCPNQVFLPKLEECNSWNGHDAIGHAKDVSLCRRYWDQKNTSLVLWLITDVGLQTAESYIRRPSAHLLPPPFLLLIRGSDRAAPVQHEKLPPECFLSWALRMRERKNNQTRADQYFLTLTHSPSHGEDRFNAADTIH